MQVEANSAALQESPFGFSDVLPKKTMRARFWTIDSGKVLEALKASSRFRTGLKVKLGRKSLTPLVRIYKVEIEVSRL